MRSNWLCCEEEEVDKRARRQRYLNKQNHFSEDTQSQFRFDSKHVLFSFPFLFSTESPESLSSKNNPNHNRSSRNVSPNNDDKLNDFGKCQIPKKVYSHSNYNNVEKCGGTRHKDSADTAESGNVSRIPSTRRKESQNFTNGNYVEVKNTDNCRMAEACTSNGGPQIAKIPRGYNAEVINILFFC